MTFNLRLRAWGAISLWMLLALGAPRAQAQETGLLPAPPFTLRDLDGKTVRLSEFKGHPVVLDFWATWCQPCRASLPHLNAVQARFGHQGLVVLGVSVDDGGPIRVRHFADHLGLRFRLAMADERVLDDYGPIRSIPTTFFIDRKGQVARRVVGYIDEDTMEEFAQELIGN